MLTEIRKEFKKHSNSRRKKLTENYFQTKKGDYGEGDIFLGIRVPTIRSIVKKYEKISYTDIEILLNSKIHEERLASLFFLVERYKNEDEKTKEKIYKFYIKNAKKVNNWDLVDVSAAKIVGDYLFNNKKEKNILLKLMKSNNLWEKRISIVATHFFIKKEEFDLTLKISKHLLNDSHHLIHKAVGWMLREVGKKNQRVLEQFLKTNCKNLPRTTLRYAIERFEEKKRQYYLKL